MPAAVVLQEDEDRLCLGSTALLPAIQVEKIALTTLPREFLVADTHILWKRSMRAVQVLLKDQILAKGKDDDWSTDKDRDLDPSPEFSPFFRM